MCTEFESKKIIMHDCQNFSAKAVKPFLNQYVEIKSNIRGMIQSNNREEMF